MLLKDWWYAFKVCRKYGISWNPFFKRTHGEYVFSYNMESRWNRCRINLNPFYENFMDTFLHEVGHCLLTRKMFKYSYTELDFALDKSEYFQEEYDAWKFAKRVLKKRFNSSWAQQCFKTYFKSYAKQVGSVRAADKYYELDRKLAK